MTTLTVHNVTDVRARSTDHVPPTSCVKFTSLTLSLHTAEPVPPFGAYEVTALGIPPALAHALVEAINAASDAMVRKAADGPAQEAAE